MASLATVGDNERHSSTKSDVRVWTSRKRGHRQESVCFQMPPVLTEDKLHHCFQQLSVLMIDVQRLVD